MNNKGSSEKNKKYTLKKILFGISLYFAVMFLVTGVMLFIDPSSGQSQKRTEVYEFRTDLPEGAYVQLTAAEAEVFAVSYELKDVNGKLNGRTVTTGQNEVIYGYIRCRDTEGNTFIIRREYTIPDKDRKSVLTTYADRLESCFEGIYTYAEEINAAGADGTEIHACVCGRQSLKGTADSRWNYYLAHDRKIVMSQMLMDVDVLMSYSSELSEGVRNMAEYVTLEQVYAIPDYEENGSARGTAAFFILLSAGYFYCIFRRHKKRISAEAERVAEKTEDLQKQIKNAVSEQKTQLETKRERNAIITAKESELKEQEAEAAKQEALAARQKAYFEQRRKKEELAARKAEEERLRKLAEEEARDRRMEELLEKARMLPPVGRELVHPAGQILLFEALAKLVPELGILKEPGHSAEVLYTTEITTGEQMLSVFEQMMEEMLPVLDDSFDAGVLSDDRFTEEELLAAVKALDFYAEYSVGNDSFTLIKAEILQMLAERK